MSLVAGERRGSFRGRANRIMPTPDSSILRTERGQPCPRGSIISPNTARTRLSALLLESAVRFGALSACAVVMRARAGYSEEMKRLMLFELLLALCFAPVACPGGTPFAAGRWVDLTHDFSSNTIY